MKDEGGRVNDSKLVGRQITEDVIAEAWELRRAGIYTMREIAERLGVSREALIDMMREVE